MKICYITVWPLGGRHTPSSAHSLALGPFSRVLSFNAGSSTPKDQTIAFQRLPVYRTGLRPAVVLHSLDGRLMALKMPVGTRVFPYIFFYDSQLVIYTFWARYQKEEVWKQHWDTSCCHFGSKPRHISFPEGSLENQETPTSLQAPEMPWSCSFSKHSQCVHALVTQVSPCLAPEGWKVWCQALILGQQCREATQPEDSTLPSPQCALLALEPLLPSCRGLLTRDALAHTYLLWFQIPSLQPMLMFTLLCTQAAALTGCWSSPLPQLFFSVCQVSPSLPPSLSSFFLVGSRLLDSLPGSA